MFDYLNTLDQLRKFTFDSPNMEDKEGTLNSFKLSLFGKELKNLFYFFWLIPRRLNFMCRPFATFCSIFKGGISFLPTPPMKMELTVCSETSAHKLQTPVNHPKEIGQYSKHGESLK